MVVGLFIKDFKMGTKISKKLSEYKHTFGFCDSIKDINSNLKLVIIDLNDLEFGDINFIRDIYKKNKNLKVIGYIKDLKKDYHLLLKEAGCEMILSKRSITNNIESFLPD